MHLDAEQRLPLDFYRQSRHEASRTPAIVDVLVSTSMKRGRRESERSARVVVESGRRRRGSPRGLDADAGSRVGVRRVASRP
jgi:hypothetical protein